MCYFSRAGSPTTITIGRWQSIVGKLIGLEVAKSP
jgi:hypothetical protein